MSKYDTLVDHSNDSELQFQNFVLSDDTTTRQPQYAPQQNFGFGEQTTTSTTNAGFWTVEYYQQYFDVDSDQVGKRMMSSLIPTGNFLEQVGNNLELYGPFWISTTVIFALFVASSIAESIVSYMAGVPFNYDFRLLSFAMTTAYVYAFVVPVIVWLLCKWLGASSHLLELVEIYGYSMTIWIPVSFLAIVPMELFRWALVIVAGSISGYFLLRNVLSIVGRSDNKSATTIVLAFVLAAQVALVLLLKFYFFACESPCGQRIFQLTSKDSVKAAPPSPSPAEPDTPAPTPSPAPGNDTQPDDGESKLF